MSTTNNPFHLINDQPFAPNDQPFPSNDQTNVQAAAAPVLKGPLGVLILVSVFSSTFLFALDTTITAVVQPKIIQRFGHIEELPWVSVGAALGGVSVNLIWGKLYGQFDIKSLFISAVLIFEVGSTLCAAAPSMNVFIVGRTCSGLGGSGLYIGAISIITAFTTLQERSLYMGFFGITWSLATILGPIIGGAITDSKATWRWGFYLNLCVAAVVAPIYIFLIPSHKPTSKPSATKNWSGDLDILGSILFVGLTTSLTMGISFGGAVYSWSSGQTIGLFVCSAVLTILFALQQVFCFTTTKDDRLFPVQFLGSSEITILFLQVSTVIPCLYIPIYFIPLFFQFVHGDTALESGVRLLPFMCVAIVAAMLNGALLPKFIYMPWFLVGGILAMVGGTLLYHTHLDSSPSLIYGYSVILAFGTGLFIQTPFTVAQARVEPQLVPLVTAFISCGQISSITFSLAIANCIFLNRATSRIEKVLPTVSIDQVQAAIAGVDAAFLTELAPNERAGVLAAIVATIDDVYIVVIAGAAFAVALSLFMKREKLGSNKITDDTTGDNGEAGVEKPVS